MAAIEVTARWEGGFRMVSEVRGFTIPADEPPEAGGDDTGPTPTGLFLASLAACLGMAVVYTGRKRGVELPDLVVTATGTYQGPRFARIRVEVRSSYPSEELSRLLERAVHSCYISNTLATPPALEFAVGS